MADVKWIKITTDIFDDEKILLIESMPEADSIIVIWFKLLCLAGKQNNSGVFMLSDKIPYTDKMLATIFRRKEATVQMALNIFEQFGMIEIIDGVITIPNWGKHQNLDQLESKKEYMRGYMQEYRAKQKQLSINGKSNCKTNSKTNVSKADKEEDKEIDKEKEKKIHIAESSSDNPAEIPESEKPIAFLPLVDGTEYGIKQTDVDGWALAYPAINITQEIHKMRSWLEANPKNKKTARGIKRFVVNWLGRSQDGARKPQTERSVRNEGTENSPPVQRYGTYL